jgi:hypothetical protein
LTLAFSTILFQPWKPLLNHKVPCDNFRMNTGMVDMVPLIIWLVYTILHTCLFQFWSVCLFWQWAFQLRVQIVCVCLAC